MQSCSNCGADFGYDAGWDDPPKVGDGHIGVAFNPTDDPVVLSETRYYCSISCLQADTDEVPEGLLDGGDSR